jgi:hypothetical protein
MNTQGNNPIQKKKIYGKDLKFSRIYELIKMRGLISAKDRDYFLSEKKHYDL